LSDSGTLTVARREELWRIARFAVLFGVAFGVFMWLLDGHGPVDAVNRVIHGWTEIQTLAAAKLVGLLGGSATAQGTYLGGPGFSCEVDVGCNGMSAAALLLAGLVSFPAGWRARIAGAGLLLPAVFAVNVVRLAGLYWTGVHWPELFAPMHVYVGQAVVILVSAGLWLAWLSWNSPSRAASS